MTDLSSTEPTTSSPRYALVALPIPMRKLFEYRLPNEHHQGNLEGCRVSVNFNGQQLVGIIMSCVATPSYTPEKIKPVTAIIDGAPVVPADILQLSGWAAGYYHHPIGESLFTALPQQLRQGKDNRPKASAWQLTSEGKGLPESALKRAPKQQQAFRYLLQFGILTSAQLETRELSTATLRALQEKGIAEKTEAETAQDADLTQESSAHLLNEAAPALTQEQQVAIDQVRYHRFTTYLLEGATGSGKTEVYLQMVTRVLEGGGQALVLIPEIGLTPQTVKRFKQRFNCTIAELHSNVSEARRHQNWTLARDGHAKIVIGTRLASLTPMPKLGIIIIDEEHDLSYKQQDGLRYSARDLSIYRASTRSIPIVLGSATPSLESLHNAIQGRYEHLRLIHRAGNARPPSIRVVDLRQQKLHAGLSQEALDTLGKTLSAGHQAIVFINRRGYAPTLLCHSCGWVAECRHCDSHLTLHHTPRHLHCHYCDNQQPVPRRCPSCQGTELNARGLGTEQTEHSLQQAFPQFPVIRIDRDSTQKKHVLAQTLDWVAKGEPCVLIGTQMLAKGHHLPKIALVVIVDCDQGLLSSDFRGPERMGQLVVQVAGRAGREEIHGHVLIQSHTPDHPLLQCLLEKGYHRFARQLLTERQATSLPPFSHTVLFRAESKRANNAVEFLQMVCSVFEQLEKPTPAIQYLGPTPARMEKVNERFRYQFQIKARSRKQLQTLLKAGLERVDQHALAKRTRWSVDVDALES